MCVWRRISTHSVKGLCFSLIAFSLRYNSVCWRLPSSLFASSLPTNPLLVSQGYAWHIRNDEAVADGHAPSPCPLAWFVSRAGGAERHYLLSGFFSCGVQPGLRSERGRRGRGLMGERMKKHRRWRDGRREREREREKERAWCPPVVQVISWSAAPCPAVCTHRQAPAGCCLLGCHASQSCYPF